MKRYESAIRVITAFFAVLLGFGLKRLLDNDRFDPNSAEIPCFILSVLLFVRFLLGSSNHMWFEFVRPDLITKSGENYPVPKIRILFDFSFLLIFGGLGMAICYSKNIEQFLNINALLICTALFWLLLYLVGSSIREKIRGIAPPVPQRRWLHWYSINLTQLLAIFLAKCSYIRRSLDAAAWWPEIGKWSFISDLTYWTEWLPSLTLSILILVYFVIFLWDVWYQLNVLQHG